MCLYLIQAVTQARAKCIWKNKTKKVKVKIKPFQFYF